MENEDRGASNSSAPLSLEISGLSPMIAVDHQSSIPENIHTVFLLHGLWGKASDLFCLKDTLEKEARSRATEEAVEVFICTSYESSRTYDGVDVCADRTVDEIRRYVDSRTPRQVVKFSILGCVICALANNNAAHSTFL